MNISDSLLGFELPPAFQHEYRSPSGYEILGQGHVLLEFKDQNSDKFWGFFEDAGPYLVFWGRNGRRPQQSQRVSRSEASSRLREKLSKGYMVAAQSGKIQKAFMEAPEWFDRLTDTSESFKALMEAAKLHKNVPLIAPQLSLPVKKKEFRL